MLNENYKVVIVEADFYALHAINSYLAWDRRTRVTFRASDLESLYEHLSQTIEAELPDTILLDDTFIPTPADALAVLDHIQDYCETDVLVLAHQPTAQIAQTIQQAGGRGYLKRVDVGLQISWLIGWAKDHEFVVTTSTASFLPNASILPKGRDYPELTERVRQALMLCVVEGMSADLAADEMGLSPHTIRTYIKEGYSILEAHSNLEYPPDLSPQEKAFMRFTALAMQDAKLEQDTLEKLDQIDSSSPDE